MDDLIEQMTAAMRDAEEHPFASYEALVRAALAAIAAHPRYELVELPEPDGPIGCVDGKPSGLAWRRDGAYGGWSTVAVQDGGDVVVAGGCLHTAEDVRWLAGVAAAAAKAAEEAKG